LINAVPQGHQLNAAEHLYKNIEDEEIEKQVIKLHKPKAQLEETKSETPKHQPLKPEIVYDDFAKLDLRVGTITAAEKVEKADKLLKLTVDMGLEIRTIVSGIAEHFKPEEIIGKQVSVVANLAPRKLKGIDSQGMILMAENAQGKLEFVSPSTDFENGAIVR